MRVPLCFALLSACAPAVVDQTIDGAEPLAGSGDVPCDVRETLQANCQKCHSATPIYGAPMPLVTWADTQAQSKTDTSKTVWQRMGERIHDAKSPMPPTGILPESELAVLDAWLGAGAPRGTAGQQCGANDGPPPLDPTSTLPCPENERATFRAHADAAHSDAPFAVPEHSGNLTMCFTFAAPWPSGTQATAFAPIIDDKRVVHHWILFETAEPQPENGVGPCKMPGDAGFLQGWAPGNDGVPLPPDVGLHLPERGKWLILQVHYWNGAAVTDSRDRSGVAMCTTNGGTPRPHTAVVSTLGTAAINLPPRSSDVGITGSCTPTATKEPLHVIAAGPHMHKHGKSIGTEIIRAGSTDRRTPLVHVPSWNFDLQRTYPTDTIINPGDKLLTTCRFDNPSDRRVTFGERTEDEMCFNFVVVWPAPGLINDDALEAGMNRCID